MRKDGKFEFVEVVENLEEFASINDEMIKIPISENKVSLLKFLELAPEILHDMSRSSSQSELYQPLLLIKQITVIYFFSSIH